MTTRLELAQYPLDKTGKNIANLIQEEPHDLSTLKTRAIIPNAGPFFTQSVRITDMNSGEVLVPRQHYKAIELLAKATETTGKEVCCAIIITDGNVSNNVVMTYQCIGGPYIHSSRPLENLIENLNIEERPVSWGDVLDKPSMFPPAAHLHDIGDVYGFEDIVYVLEAIRYAILLGDEASHDQLRKLLQDRYDELKALIAENAQALTQHIEDKENPHQVTKAQVGLGLVENYPPATAQEARDGTADNRLITPKTLDVRLDKHSESGDHDERYVRIGAPVNGSIRVHDGMLQGYVNGRWVTIWPAQWA